MSLNSIGEGGVTFGVSIGAESTDSKSLKSQTEKSDRPENKSEPVSKSTSKNENPFGIEYDEEDDYTTESEERESAESREYQPEKDDDSADEPAYSKEDILKFKDAFDNFTKKSQRMAEERKEFERQRAEFENIKKQDAQNVTKERLKQFDELDITKKMSTLYETVMDYNGLKETVEQLKGLIPIVQNYNKKMLLSDIKNAVKKMDGVDISDDHIYRVVEMASKNRLHVTDVDSFMFAYNATKGSVARKLVDEAETRGKETARKESTERRQKFDIMDGGKRGEGSPSKVSEMSPEQRRAEALKFAKTLF